LIISLRTRLETGERSTVLRGGEQFERILEHFKGRYTGIRGSWYFEDNLAGFNRAIGEGKTPEAAALETWTGQQAQRAGYTRATILQTEGAVGSYTKVEVVFTRPELPAAPPHTPAPSGTTRLPDTPHRATPSRQPGGPGPIGRAAPPTGTSIIVGGFVPATVISPISYSLVPVRRNADPPPSTQLEVLDLDQEPHYLTVPASMAEDARDPQVQRVVLVFRSQVRATTAAARSSPVETPKPSALRLLLRGPLEAMLGRTQRTPIPNSLFELVNETSADSPRLSSAVAGRTKREALASAANANEKTERAATGAGMVAMLTSLGGSTGDVFRIQVLKNDLEPLEISTDGLVAEPLLPAAQRAMQQQIAQLAGKQALTATVSAYCLEFLREPPTAGMIFRIAAPDVQERFSPVRSVLRAAQRVELAGLLQSDGGNFADYVHSIRQWAVWVKEQRFSMEGFKKAFVEHTRKNVEQAGHRWTPQVESAIERIVPHRWNQITLVLEEANAR
jgi:hypothetical protein